MSVCLSQVGVLLKHGASAAENLASLHVIAKVAEKLLKITACQKLLVWMKILSNKLLCFV